MSDQHDKLKLTLALLLNGVDTPSLANVLVQLLTYEQLQTLARITQAELWHYEQEARNKRIIQTSWVRDPVRMGYIREDGTFISDAELALAGNAGSYNQQASLASLQRLTDQYNAYSAHPLTQASTTSTLAQKTLAETSPCSPPTTVRRS